MFILRADGAELLTWYQ